MNKAMKRRQKRKERDLRWAGNPNGDSIFGSHRMKKIFGVPKREDGKRSAFWCNVTDPIPRVSRLWRACFGETVRYYKL